MKILLIGYGSIGKRHCRILKETYPGCEIDLVSKQSIPGYRVFNDMGSLNGISSYDYFVICSETHLHYEQLAWINSRVSGKKVLVEKALFHKWAPLEPINNLIYVGYEMRYGPVLQFLKKELADQKILFAGAYAGQYLPDWHPHADYRNSYSALKAKGGGVLLDLSHELDYLQWLAGVIVEVVAFNSRISALEIDTDDIVTGVAKTREGTVLNFTMDYISKVIKRQVLIHTEEYSYFCDLIDSDIVKGGKLEGQSVIRFEKTSPDEPYREMHRAILEKAGGDSCTFYEGMKILQVCETIRNSFVEGACHVQ